MFFLLLLRQQTQTIDAMKIYKWFRELMKASALTTVMFIMQACYGTPKDLDDIVEIHISGYVTDKVTGRPLEGVKLRAYHSDGYDGCNDFDNTDENGYFNLLQWGNIHRISSLALEVRDNGGNYQPFDTLVYSDSDLTDLKIKLITNQ